MAGLEWEYKSIPRRKCKAHSRGESCGYVRAPLRKNRRIEESPFRGHPLAITTSASLTNTHPSSPSPTHTANAQYPARSGHPRASGWIRSWPCCRCRCRARAPRRPSRCHRDNGTATSMLDLNKKDLSILAHHISPTCDVAAGVLGGPRTY